MPSRNNYAFYLQKVRHVQSQWCISHEKDKSINSGELMIDGRDDYKIRKLLWFKASCYICGCDFFRAVKEFIELFERFHIGTSQVNQDAYNLQNKFSWCNHGRSSVLCACKHKYYTVTSSGGKKIQPKFTIQRFVLFLQCVFNILNLKEPRISITKKLWWQTNNLPINIQTRLVPLSQASYYPPKNVVNLVGTPGPLLQPLFTDLTTSHYVELISLQYHLPYDCHLMRSLGPKWLEAWKGNFPLFQGICSKSLIAFNKGAKWKPKQYIYLV